MALNDDLVAATNAGIITTDQARRLEAFIAQRGNGPVAGDGNGEERLRLIGGFNDIFVAIGIGLVYWAMLTFFGAGSAEPPVLLGGSAAIAWLLAEVFTRRMRLALPSILLALIFCGSIMGAVGYAVAPGLEVNAWDAMVFAASYKAYLPALALIGAAAVHFWRFSVPLDVALGTIGVAAAGVIVFAQWNLAFLMANYNLVALIVGIAIFALAMAFDMSDPPRRTWRADAAFWLHMLAAPLIVHPAVFGLAGGPTLTMNGSPAVILALFAAFTIIAIIIDRRAMIVSALAYAGGAIGYYLADDLVGGTGVTLLALGAVILTLSAGWKPLRRLIIPLLPLGTLKQRLPPA
jgi:hypothetical protein